MFAPDLAVGVGVLHPEAGENLQVEPDKRNRRTAKRYDLHLPFEYRLFGRDQSVQEGCGWTINMSSGGLLVASDQRISKGQPIEISIQLHPQLKEATGARLVILGHVLRSGPTGAAIKTLRHGFVRGRDPEPPPDRVLAGV